DRTGDPPAPHADELTPRMRAQRAPARCAHAKPRSARSRSRRLRAVRTALGTVGPARRAPVGERTCDAPDYGPDTRPAASRTRRRRTTSHVGAPAPPTPVAGVDQDREYRRRLSVDASFSAQRSARATRTHHRSP